MGSRTGCGGSRTGEDLSIPALVLVATLLLFWQNLRPPRPSASDDFALPSRPGVVFLLQLLVSVYRGYFGAGIGIVMLALLSSFAGGADIHFGAQAAPSGAAWLAPAPQTVGREVAATRPGLVPTSAG
ncbi:uncharacterized protein SOCEGT47_017810 [Sorangium cellulosum]|uniref:Uncharacterized protein n=1 Tax=Sorangium cellulosum TaxID=56 RepID=A0A4P2PX40_SORCE|nr:hypothetical protein [Sorangium cellulosum]AUX21300.1 uncharacterized protein SOCEGT47_017810 [Sorangium cellulosum]